VAVPEGKPAGWGSQIDARGTICSRVAGSFPIEAAPALTGIYWAACLDRPDLPSAIATPTRSAMTLLAFELDVNRSDRSPAVLVPLHQDRVVRRIKGP